MEWQVYNQLDKASPFTNIARHPDWQVCSQIVSDRREWSIAMGILEDGLLDSVTHLTIATPVAVSEMMRDMMRVGVSVLL